MLRIDNFFLYLRPVYDVGMTSGVSRVQCVVWWGLFVTLTVSRAIYVLPQTINKGLTLTPVSPATCWALRFQTLLLQSQQKQTLSLGGTPSNASTHVGDAAEIKQRAGEVIYSTFLRRIAQVTSSARHQHAKDRCCQGGGPRTGTVCLAGGDTRSQRALGRCWTVQA